MNQIYTRQNFQNRCALIEFHKNLFRDSKNILNFNYVLTKTGPQNNEFK